MEAEIAVLQSEAKECLATTRSWKGQEMGVPLEPLEGEWHR